MTRSYRVGFAVVFVSSVLAACAPRTVPEPIRAEPVFDKYGAPLCRPADRPISSAYPERLPICEDLCEEGRQIPGAAPQVICPPEQRRPDRTPDGGGDGTPQIPGATSMPPASIPPATAAPSGPMTTGTAPRP